MSKRKIVLAAAAAASLAAGAGAARADLVGQWVGDTYVTGSSWSDSSPNGNTGFQAGAAGAAVPVATPNAFNGHTGVTFAGGMGANAVGGFFNVQNGTPNGGVQGASALTLVAVFKPIAAGESSGGQFWQKSGLIGNEQGGDVPDWGLVFGPQVVAAGVGGPDTTIASGNVALNTTHVAIQQWDTSGNLTLYVDGTQAATQLTMATAPRTAVAFPAFALGANLSAVNGDLKVFNGQIAELRVYNDITSINPVTLSNQLLATYTPEPGGIGLIVLGGFGLLRRRRRAPA